nr:MAG TPA: hypothetical protein [Caudoviricetes sp.]
MFFAFFICIFIRIRSMEIFNSSTWFKPVFIYSSIFIIMYVIFLIIMSWIIINLSKT